jgi:hypothetical protein
MPIRVWTAARYALDRNQPEQAIMRKAVSDGTRSTKEGSGRRYWVRSVPQEPRAAASESKRPSKARFLEPYRLSEERRAALLEPLIAGGIGDSESRDLVAAAVEYDIASCRQSEPECTTESEAASETEALLPNLHGGSIPGLGDQTRALADAFDALDQPSRAAVATALHRTDPFRRGYDEGYLEAVGAELRRIADAVSSTAAAPAPPADPPISDAARRLVRRIGSAFEECFERKAAIAEGGPLEPILRLIASEAGIRLPRDAAALAGALARR